MPVAPSFAEFTRISDKPFTKNGKYYVTVENPKTGNRRDVRWYSESEYAKAYGKTLVDTNRSWENLKTSRGFDKGPILVIRRNRPEDENWLRQSCARYAVGIGWHIVSTDIFPNDAPEHLKYVLLGWEEFRKDDDNHMKSPTELAEIIDEKVRKRQWFNINGK